MCVCDMKVEKDSEKGEEAQRELKGTKRVLKYTFWKLE